jgi:hypothetical protein
VVGAGGGQREHLVPEEESRNFKKLYAVGDGVTVLLGSQILSVFKWISDDSPRNYTTSLRTPWFMDSGHRPEF